MIELKNLTIGYKEPLIEDINYKFDEMSYAILGESGCGKTTLLRTICGLQCPISGQVIVDDNVVGDNVPKGMFMMHQHYSNYNWLTCLESVTLSAKISGSVTKNTKEEALAALDAVLLKDKAYIYPYELSGGQKQRLALARTIFMKPKYILMDEPLSALDPVTRKAMQDLIKNFQHENESTILMITHSEEEAERVCHKIIKLKKGKMQSGI